MSVREQYLQHELTPLAVHYLNLIRRRVENVRDELPNVGRSKYAEHAAAAQEAIYVACEALDRACKDARKC